MAFDKIGPEKIRVFPLAQRKSKTNIVEAAVNPDETPKPLHEDVVPVIRALANRIRQARESGASVMLAYGAHLVKNGAAPLVIKLIEEGWITHVATNGAGTIHDWEFSFQGVSEEDVRANVVTGTFGTWEETGKYINLAVLLGAVEGMGYGESLGRFISTDELIFPELDALEYEIMEGLRMADPYLPAKSELLNALKQFGLSGKTLRIEHPFKKYSIACAAYENGIPMTVHPGIGYDIIYNNPYANGAAIGRAAHTDFGIFVHSVKKLSNGVFLSIGSAIMAPQIFEKAISFANNVLLQEGQKVEKHFILVDDLQESVWDWSKGEPPKESPDYYLRFLKSFYRMGGEVQYLSLDNRLLLHHLYHELKRG